MALNTDQAWQKYGEQNPYFGVLTDEKFLKDNLTEERKLEFFASGEAYVSEVFENLRREFELEEPVQNILDFGCGTGRLVIPFSKRSQKVTGIDISEAMLKEANNNAHTQECQNILFHNSSNFFTPENREKFDIVHSFIVLQHIETKRGYAIFEDLYHSLKQDGIGIIHLTYDSKDNSLQKIKNYLNYRIPLLNNLMNLIKGKPFNLPLIQMHNYNINKVFQFLQKAGVGKTFIQFTDHGWNNGVILYFQKKEKTKTL